MIRFELGPTMMEARRLAQQSVRQRLKEQGLKIQQYSFKELREQGEEYLRLHTEELVDLASANIRTDTRKPNA